MASAKFVVVGETDMWARVRIQEEINSHGLDGTVIDAEGGKLGVFVSGDRMKIQSLYNDLSEKLPDETQPTNLIYGEFKRPRVPDVQASSEDAFKTLIELLREIEKNTRKMNQKLDRLIDGRQTTLAGSEDESTEGESHWYSSSSTIDEEEGDETATDAFSKMFG